MSPRNPLSLNIGRCGQWARDVRGYWRECDDARDFLRLIRVRLSKRKLVPWLTPRPGVVEVNLKSLGRGVRLRSHSTDISVLAEILFDDLLGHLPQAPAVHMVIDLGANTGLAYRWLRCRYPVAKFVCVEPDPGNLEILRSHIDGNCQVIAACVGGRERKVNLATSDGEWAFRIVDVGAGDGDTPVITMDRLMHDTGIEHIDVLKCDIEGAETELFADCRTWIGKVDTMVVECHLDMMSTESLLQMLATNGAEFDVIHVEHNPAGFENVTLERAVGRDVSSPESASRTTTRSAANAR